ncbi:DHHC_palmitoyltransferase [Hexamita inflata]|uniref:Palmitoyltransferase n=1 Tax=Hexamita inflata TaxID=28002 RepID=A0AA86P6G1_9EUKA|nr:DHHC palmitoyltransferase [Hexamita inflata]CAI9967290.1 DHHC palmitoyltransferase [Hexamita inflata]
MRAIYKNKIVIGSQFYCVVITCAIFLILPVVHTLIMYLQLNRTDSFLIFIPIYVLSLITVSFYIKTSLTDPGVIPKRIKTPVSSELIDSNIQPAQTMMFSSKTLAKMPSASLKVINEMNCEDDIEMGMNISIPQFVTNNIKATNKISVHFVQNTHCSTCNVEKPPGVAHCPLCKHCVLSHDHHCPWVGTCIGIRNYKYFILCVVFTLLYFATLLGYYSWTVYIQSKTPSLWLIVTAVCVFVSLFGFFFGLTMTIQHIKLIMIDQTTRSELKNRSTIKVAMKLSALASNSLDSVAYYIKNDPILSKLKYIKHTGLRRLMYGNKMPILRHMNVSDAEETAWKWVIALSVLD